MPMCPLSHHWSDNNIHGMLVVALVDTTPWDDNEVIKSSMIWLLHPMVLFPLTFPIKKRRSRASQHVRKLLETIHKQITHKLFERKEVGCAKFQPYQICYTMYTLPRTRKHQDLRRRPWTQHYIIDKNIMQHTSYMARRIAEWCIMARQHLV
jgi:hypothetical protein